MRMGTITQAQLTEAVDRQSTGDPRPLGVLLINVAGSVFCLESVSTASTAVLTFPIGFALGATAGFTTATKAAFIRAL